MSDFQADGQPWEPPASARALGYADTPPNWGRPFGAQISDAASFAPLGRAVARGRFAGSSPADQAIVAALGQDEWGNPREGMEPGAIETPTLQPAEAKEKYAPIGPDGKKVDIFDKPIPEGVAKLIGEAKAAEIKREGILDRYAKSTSMPVVFATGVAAFLMDPLNAATMFLPGVGEEAILARVGTSVGGKLLARGVAGAASGAIAQAPLSALRYGLGTEEGSDYDLRSAFRDMMFASAGGAVLHAGFGAAADIIKTRLKLAELPAKPAEAPAEAPPGAAAVLTADAGTTAGSMRISIAQVAEGREVNVMPAFNEQSMRLLSEEARLRERHAALAEFTGNLEVHPEAQAAAERLARVREVERQLASETITLEQRRVLGNRRDELLTNTTPETLHETAAPLEMRRQAEAEQASIAARIAEIAQERLKAETGAALSAIPKLARTQLDLWQQGSTPGMAQAEVRAAHEDIYGKTESAAGKPQAPAAAGAVSRETPVESARPGQAATKVDQDLAAAEGKLAQSGAALHPEDVAELERTSQGMQQAESTAKALQAAAECLIGAGL